jgi:nicotinamidase-related amidase
VPRVLPTIERLVARTPERTILTRFILPNLPEDAPGMWRAYYARWPHVIRDAMDTSLLKLMPQLERFVPPAHVFFATGALHAFLQTKHVDTLILTESETDVCVLSTALSAIDLDYRTIIVKDGLCSSLDDAHDASFRLYEQRHHVQIELAEASEVMDGLGALAAHHYSLTLELCPKRRVAIGNGNDPRYPDGQESEESYQAPLFEKLRKRRGEGGSPLQERNREKRAWWQGRQGEEP